jgi:hypothetical protein
MLDAGDLERALDYFLQSRRVLPTTKNTTNAAIVLERLGRFDEALELYEELLLKFAGGLQEEDREAIAPAMADLRPRVGGIEVTSNVGGSVQIDGRERGRLPLLSPIRVLPGKHTVRVVQPGYREFETTVEVGAGESKPIDAKLQALPGVGTLQVVDTEGGAADVFVDGTKLGSTPWEGALPAGRHLIWLRRGDKVGSMPAWVQVIEGQAAISKLQSLPLGPPIKVRVEPATASLEIGGFSPGVGGWQGRLPAGSYTVRASEPGYQAAARRIEAGIDAAPIDLTIRLPVDPNHPRWPRDEGSFVAEILGGAMIGPSLSGDAEDACPDACSRDPALGFLVGARGGYRFPIGIAVEFAGGYMRLTQSIERTERDSFIAVTAEGEQEATVTYDLTDDILVHGPFASVGASYRYTTDMFHLGTRASLGLLVSFSRDSVGGSASTTGPSVPVFLEHGDATAVSAAPFLAPEITAGLALGPVDLGLSLGAAFFPAQGPELERGRFGPTSSATNEADPGAVENAPESAVIDGERAYGRFVVFMPALTLGADI